MKRRTQSYKGEFTQQGFLKIWSMGERIILWDIMILFSIILLPLFGAYAAVNDPPFIIHYPKLNSVISVQDINIVVEIVSKSMDSLRVTLNDEETANVDVSRSTPQGRFAHFSYRLKAGTNSFRVEALSKGKIYHEEKVELFYYPKAAGPGMSPPAGYEASLFHLPSNENECRGCHDMQSGPVEPASVEKSPCHGCHKSLIEREVVHGPAAVFACVACHISKNRQSKYGVPEPVSEVCYGLLLVS
jgi:hypothetical protein